MKNCFAAKHPRLSVVTQENEPFTSIARQYLGIPTLRTRNWDHLDFHEVAVWNVALALQLAYEAGRASVVEEQDEDAESKSGKE